MPQRLKHLAIANSQADRDEMFARRMADQTVLTIAQQPGIPNADNVEGIHTRDVPRHVISRDRVEMHGSSESGEVNRVHASAA